MAHGDPDEKTFLYILYLVTWQNPMVQNLVLFTTFPSEIPYIYIYTYYIHIYIYICIYIHNINVDIINVLGEYPRDMGQTMCQISSSIPLNSFAEEHLQLDASAVRLPFPEDPMILCVFLGGSQNPGELDTAQLEETDGRLLDGYLVNYGQLFISYGK